MLPDILIVLSESDDNMTVPNGRTVINEGDRLILSAAEPVNVEGVRLTEITVTEDSEYIGMRLADLHMPENSLIIMIKRGEEVIVPQGSIELR